MIKAIQWIMQDSKRIEMGELTWLASIERDGIGGFDLMNGSIDGSV